MRKAQSHGFCEIKDQQLHQRAINTKLRHQGSAWIENLEDIVDYHPQLVSTKA